MAKLEELAQASEASASTPIFTATVGNPPYQDNSQGAKRNEPIYHLFMDLGRDAASLCSLIHPLKFLLDGGNTPKEWNRSVRANPTYSIPWLERDASQVFPAAGPKEGVAVSFYRGGRFAVTDAPTIEEQVSDLFSSPAQELREKVEALGLPSLADRMYSVTSYRLTETFYEEVPRAEELTPRASRSALTSNIFERFPTVFTEERQEESDLVVYGKKKGQVIHRYLSAPYLQVHPNLHRWKVLIQMAGTTTRVVGPGTCANQTFLTLGAFETEEEARNAERYVNSRFARTLVSSLQLSQFGNRRVWRPVPDLEDYTDESYYFRGEPDALEELLQSLVSGLQEA